MSAPIPRRFSSAPSRLLFVTIALALFALGTANRPIAAEERSVSADPGTLARWSQAGTRSCGMDGRIWPALGNTCWYPIDLERRPGRVEIARWGDGNIETAHLEIQDKTYELQEITLEGDTYVHLSEENLQRVYGEQAALRAVWRLETPVRFSLPLAAPLDPLPEGLFFGVRRTFNGIPKKAHNGLDYAVGQGTAVKSVADGTVVLTAEHFFSGRSVFIDHGGGLISMFFHLSETTVEQGAEVKRGEVVGKVGSTGRSTGPHLHWGVRWRRARIDPSLLLAAPESIPAVEP